MKVVLIVASGILLLIISTFSLNSRLLVCLFISFNILFDACCIGISKYEQRLSYLAIVSTISSVIPSGYEYITLIHLNPIRANFSSNCANITFPYRSLPYTDVSWAMTTKIG